MRRPAGEMDEGTTTTAAPAGPRIIERPRLTKILDASNARIILLVAPAGYGKTTLARQWLKDKPHVWYQATPASADPVALVAGLARGLKADVSAIKAIVAANRELAESPETLADLLEPALAEAPEWLVIDDYQFVFESSLSEAFVKEVITRFSQRTLITSRIRPSWAMTRDLVYGRAMELDTATLRMTDAEILSLLPESRTTATELADRTGRWPALVGLAAAGTEIRRTPAGTPHRLFYFFAEELLRGAPAEVEQWLTDCAIAPTFLTTTGPPLEYVEAGLRCGFLVPTPDGLTIHPLLREFLKSRLSAAGSAQTRTRRIAEQLTHEGRHAEAFEVIIEFAHLDLLVPLLQAYVPQLLRAGLVETARRCSARVRAAGCMGPALELIQADELERKGAFREAYELASAVAARAEERDPIRVHAQLAAGRAAYMTDRFAEAVALYESANATAQTTTDRVDALTGALLTLSEQEDRRAAEVLEKLRVVDVSENPAAALRVAVAEMHVAVTSGTIASGLAAAVSAEPLLPLVESPRVASAFLSMYSLLLAERGSFAASEPYAIAARTRAREAKLRFACAHIDLRHALACIGLGEYREASRLIMRSAMYARANADAYLVCVAATTRLKLLLAQGAVAEAASLPAPRGHTAAAFHAEWLAARAAAAALHAEPELAANLAFEADALSTANAARVAVACARAIAATVEGAPGEALTSLLTAIRGCENVEFTVACLRGSSDFSSHLQRFDVPEPLAAVRNELLRLARSYPARHTATETGGAELSPREREVLTLVSQGLTNKAIAKALFISDVTVKVHLRHIYEKLGVRRRTEAALLARDLDIGAHRTES